MFNKLNSTFGFKIRTSLVTSKGIKLRIGAIGISSRDGPGKWQTQSQIIFMRQHYEAKVSVKLHYQIQFLFNVTMTPKTIRMQKKLLKLVWRRSRKAPRLTRSQKIDRLNWCLANINNTFSNFIFTDEASFWINECPIYV